MIYDNGFIMGDHSIHKPGTLDLNDWFGASSGQVQPIKILATWV